MIVCRAIVNLLEHPPEYDAAGDRHKVYNIGNNKPEKLMHFIEVLEMCLGREAKKEFLSMQPGYVYQTYADVYDLIADFGFKPETSIEGGLGKFVGWYKDYYCIVSNPLILFFAGV